MGKRARRILQLLQLGKQRPQIHLVEGLGTHRRGVPVGVEFGLETLLQKASQPLYWLGAAVPAADSLSQADK